MRIGHYETNVHAQGGAQTYLRRLGQAQADRGHTVVYFSHVAPPSEDALSPHVHVADAADLFRQAEDLHLDVLHLHRPVESLPDDPIPTVRTMHNHNGSCISGSRLLRRTETPCNRDVHPLGCLWGHLVDRCGPRDPRRMWDNVQTLRTECQQSDAVPTVAVSAFLRERMITTGHDPDQIHVIHSPAPPPLEEASPPPTDGPPRFLFLGRLVPEKGIRWLLDATAQTEVPLHIDVAGDGPLWDDLQNKKTSYGLDDRVTVHGWCEHDTVADLMAQARAVVVPSIWHEPAGLVTLEAAAAGRAVIASRVGGMPEYAHPSFARLVAPNDTTALAQALTDLATDADRARQMGDNGLQRVRSVHTMDRFIERLHAVYADAMGTAPDAAPVTAASPSSCHAS